MLAEEKYVLNQDLRRSANSVIHNIAEGYGRYAPKDKTRFYKISRGSTYEAIRQLYVAGSQHYYSEDMVIALTGRYKNCILQLDKLIKTLETKTRLPPP